MKPLTNDELRHRGQLAADYPDPQLWNSLGGAVGVTALIEDLYRRIERDELLSVAFPHFNSGNATPPLLQWFGGDRGYSNDLTGGLLRLHQHRFISPKAAAAWLHCMRENRSWLVVSTPNRSCVPCRASRKP